jgi:hypothetical protein
MTSHLESYINPFLSHEADLNTPLSTYMQQYTTQCMSLEMSHLPLAVFAQQLDKLRHLIWALGAELDVVT